MSAAGQLVGIAASEIGYLEKSRSNWNLYGINCLYEKTKFAGADNVQKYAYETGHYKSYGWAAWCQSFVAWCLMAAFGQVMADKLLCGKYASASTMDVKNAMIKAGRGVDLNNAQPGDIVFRSRTGGGHVGIVIGWSNGKIVTIEGNSSAADLAAWNGGAVVEHTGALWNWCCRPDWSLVEPKEKWGWIQSDGVWYYQNQDGKNTHGWANIKETGGEAVHRYYFDTKGQMLKGMHWIDGELCLFMPEGPLEGAMCRADENGYQHIWYL